MKPTRVVLALVPLLALAACGGGDAPSPGAPGGSPTAAALTLPDGLTAAERERFYHLAEGSEILPYAWLRALNSASTGRPFLEDPDRFGLIADPANADGLPIGLTAATTVDTRLFGVRMTGLNCAACHVNELTYRGTRMIVVGAQATFNTDSFKSDIAGSFRKTLEDPLELLAFLWRLRREHEPANPHLSAEAQAGAARVYRAVDALPAAAERDASVRQVFDLARRAVERERALPPVDMLVGLTVAPPDSGPGAAPGPRPAPGTLPRPLTYAGAAAAADSVLGVDTVPANPTLLGDDPQAGIRHFLADLILTYRLMKARLHSFRRIAPHVATLQPGWGRVDAFGAARNVLFPRDSVPLTAPVTYPWLWGFGEQLWFHFDGNTNSQMQRNLGQAIGVGAVYDSTTKISTLNPWNIHWLELTGHKITPPAWPAQVLGPIDPAKAARGDSLFQTWCAGCHTDPTTSTLFSPDSIGTDTNRLTNFAMPMSDGRNFTAWAATFLSEVETQAFRIWNVPADSIHSFRGPTPVWRTTSRWTSRPLNGIWATPPFLHNGSVPTLYDLLLPAAQRPVTFPLGQREYDPAKLGYVTDVANPRWTFDTRTAGNRNTGHEFGTTLSADERAALLEYLKTL